MIRLALLFMAIFPCIVSKAQFDVFKCPIAEKFECYEGGQLTRIPSPAEFWIRDTGAFTIFRCVRTYDCPDWYDEAIDFSVFFQVPRTDTSFTYQIHSADFTYQVHAADSLADPVFFRSVHLGAYPQRLFIKPHGEGTVSGRRQGEVWEITLALKVVYTHQDTNQPHEEIYQNTHVYTPFKKPKKQSLANAWFSSRPR